MKKLLRSMLDDVMLTSEDEEYSHAIYNMMCGVGTTKEHKTFLNKWFVNPFELEQKTMGHENIIVFSITDDVIKIVSFDDGYNGYLFTFMKDGNKLRMLSRRVEDKDPIFSREGMTPDEIEDIFN